MVESSSILGRRKQLKRLRLVSSVLVYSPKWTPWICVSESCVKDVMALYTTELSAVETWIYGAGSFKNWLNTIHESFPTSIDATSPPNPLTRIDFTWFHSPEHGKWICKNFPMWMCRLEANGTYWFSGCAKLGDLISTQSPMEPRFR